HSINQKLEYNETIIMIALSPYRQQCLPAFRPLIDRRSTITLFATISSMLIIIGSILMHQSKLERLFRIDYTDCRPFTGTRSCSQILFDWRSNRSLRASTSPPSCHCWFRFFLSESLPSNVFIYYGLENYHQNHLHYVRSKSLDQFQGRPVILRDCEPFGYKQIDRNNRKPIVPCGTIANSLFNDSYKLWFLDHRTITSYPLIRPVKLKRTKIAWPSDMNFVKKIDPKVFVNFTNPPNWGSTTLWDLDEFDAKNNGFQNEALIVWMRVAAFPNFHKLFGRIRHDSNPFKRSLPRGFYYLRIEYNYPVKEFNGRKSILIANTNPLIGRQYNFLSILYLTIGTIGILSTLVMIWIDRNLSIKIDEVIEIDEMTPYFFRKISTFRSMLS
ncbi:Cell cycle control protein 50A, partial [Sarcoptes scabiei]